MASRWNVTENHTELSLRDVIDFILFHWKILVAMAFLFGSYTYFSSKFHPSYVSKSILLVQKSLNSPLQAVSARLSGYSLENRYDQESFERYLLYLRSPSFYRVVAKTIIEEPKYIKFINDALEEASPLWGVSSPKQMTDERLLEAKEELAFAMLGVTGIEQSGPDSISLTVSTASRRSSVVLVNLISKVAVEQISGQLLRELDEAKTFIDDQLLKIELS